MLGDCGLKPQDKNGDVNRQNKSTRHRNYIRNTICKHNMCIKVNRKWYNKSSVKILSLDCTVTFLCFIVYNIWFCVWQNNLTITNYLQRQRVHSLGQNRSFTL